MADGEEEQSAILESLKGTLMQIWKSPYMF